MLHLALAESEENGNGETEALQLQKHLQPKKNGTWRQESDVYVWMCFLSQQKKDLIYFSAKIHVTQ